MGACDFSSAEHKVVKEGHKKKCAKRIVVPQQENIDFLLI